MLSSRQRGSEELVTEDSQYQSKEEMIIIVACYGCISSFMILLLMDTVIGSCMMNALLRKQIVLLTEGMRVYTAQIVSKSEE